MKTEEFRLDRDYIELCALLKLVGAVNTGGEAKAIIAGGQVKVDSVLETRKRCKIRVGQEVQYESLKILIKKAEEND